MINKRTYLCLDVGTQRIGVALGDSIGRIAEPLTTIHVDGQEARHLAALIEAHEVTDLVIGLPRDQAGNETAQTSVVRHAATAWQTLGLPQHWQDESVTSILAEERLKHRKKGYTKADIDAEAAAIILQDFLEASL